MKSAPISIEFKLTSLVAIQDIKLPQKLALKLHFWKSYAREKRNKKNDFFRKDRI